MTSGTKPFIPSNSAYSDPMQKSLWLIRHAKSAEPCAGERDFDRELSATGLADVKRLTDWLKQPKQQQSEPLSARQQPCDWVWSSTAVRAHNTAASFAKHWQCPLLEEDTLYLAGQETIIHCLQTTPETMRHIALVGHNPGITECANYLAGTEAYENIPTLGMVHYLVTSEWVDLNPEQCQMSLFLTPKSVRKQS